MADPTTPHDENSLAVYSVFCGAVAVVTAFLFGLGALFGVMAIVLGNGGLQRASDGQGRRELAVAGMALGALGIVIGVAIIVS
jgi:hypothetical protein